MNEKFKNKYRIPSARAQWWDYGMNAAYFVTICTANRQHILGEIIESSSVRLSDIGRIANDCWAKITIHFPFAILGSFVIMPNHIHGIIVIDKPPVVTDKTPVVETRLIASLPSHDVTVGGFAGNKNPILNNNLSRIVRWYKGVVSFQSRKINAEFAWQSRFYDRIIRNDDEYKRIAEYITDNPANWEKDKLSDKEQR
jgi:REP element-mobilizing transposase RayT